LKYHKPDELEPKRKKNCLLTEVEQLTEKNSVSRSISVSHIFVFLHGFNYKVMIDRSLQ